MTIQLPDQKVTKKSSEHEPEKSITKPTFRIAPFFRGLLGFAGLGIAFETAVVASGLPEEYMPRLWTVLSRTMSLFSDGEFLAALGSTLAITFVGLAIAGVVAVPLGVILGSWKPLYASSAMLIELMRPIPAVVLLPPALLMIGSGVPMKLTLISYASVWIILNNVVYAVHDVDKMTIETVRVYGLSRIKELWVVTLHSSGPFILAGIRLATTAAFLTAVSIEMIGGGVDGVGTWLLDSQYAATRKADVFAGAIFLGGVGVALHGGFNLLDKFFFKWSNANRSET